MERLAGYVRVSSGAQARSGIGLAAQRRQITEAAAAGGYEVVWFEDAGRSGATMRGRPGLQAALAEIAAGRAAGLVAAKIDRLGRSSADVLGLVERAQREGWRLVALDCGLDTATPAGELVATALAMAARFEFRRASERQREKHAELRRQGRPRGRSAVPRDVADRIIESRERGLSFAKIAKGLNAAGTPTARGADRWQPATVRSAYLTRRRELDAQH